MAVSSVRHAIIDGPTAEIHIARARSEVTLLPGHDGH
jgi:hypothetical protein